MAWGRGDGRGGGLDWGRGLARGKGDGRGGGLDWGRGLAWRRGDGRGGGLDWGRGDGRGRVLACGRGNGRGGGLDWGRVLAWGGGDGRRGELDWRRGDGRGRVLACGRGDDRGGELDWRRGDGREGEWLATLYIITVSPVVVTTGTTTTDFTAPLVRIGGVPSGECVNPARLRANGTLMGHANQSEVRPDVDVGVMEEGWAAEWLVAAVR